jgi:isoamylase
VIYELHVRGFTRHPSAGLTPEKAGTYAGLIEKIPYLADLGITAVELMPVFQFDTSDARTGVNYWGYSPVSFFAPHRGYSSRQDLLGPIDEFRDMVRALHRAGIEVILDVVFNHTAEGDNNGPTFCFRGLENEAYYILEHDRSCYADYSGTSNTLNANQPIVRRMILDSLRYWVTAMHVDGFRFDLASVLARDETGAPLRRPPIIWDIESDPVLAGTKMIAEAWDAAGLYQVGSFVGDSWHEWNGRFRDDTRRFLKGDRCTASYLAPRLLGSPDIYGHKEREPEQSINFVTCHDGFTLNDLVSYNEKHNAGNGEDNRDGMNDNLSWNCGAEGPTENPEIEGLRSRQIKNFLTLNMLAVGTPMLLMGDEMRRTQRGNNNPYCQDNEISWLDWNLLKRYADIHRFVKLLVAFRGRRDVVIEGSPLSLNELLARAQLDWHGIGLHSPDWSDDSHSIAFTVSSLRHRFTIHAMVNAYWEPLTFELPADDKSQDRRWRRWIDTALPSPDDISPWEEATNISQTTHVVASRSLVLLIDMVE